VLTVLDADLTMPPEALPKYHAVIESGKADFVNRTRLVYPMEQEAMRPLSFIAQSLLCLFVQLPRQYPSHRHVVRHQGVDAQGL
jgi:hypothetical protein